MADYNKLVNLMGEHQDLAIFRRFQNLNIKTLIYMQADILHLEQELNIVEYEDKRSDDKSRASLHASFFNLKESSGERHDVQWNKVKEIQEKLGLYIVGTSSLVLVAQYLHLRSLFSSESDCKTCGDHGLYHHLLVDTAPGHESEEDRHICGDYSVSHPLVFGGAQTADAPDVPDSLRSKQCS
ncbi:MAG: hypothetical protein Q9211_006282 [Gyalolechia sp. 1 TL-2023]